MTHLLKEHARILSQRERVAAEQPGEGLLTWPVILSFVSRKRRPWGARASDVGSAANFFDDPVKPFLQFVIGETKLNETVALDRRAARGIALHLAEMMFAIEFDRQAKIVAAEIGDESSDRDLSTEFQSIELTTAKLLPKHVLGRSAVGPQTPRNFDSPFRHAPQSDHQRLRSQPLTRRLRRHPLPQGEGLGACR
jgi:hypothetical protein